MGLGLLRAAVILAAVLAPAAAAGTGCSCASGGARYAEGTCICIVISGRQRYACCGKVLNNTSWTFRDGGCPVALDADDAGGAAAAPTRLADRNAAGAARTR